MRRVRVAGPLFECLSGEEERTIGEHQELDAEILAHYEKGLERERLLRGGAAALEASGRH